MALRNASALAVNQRGTMADPADEPGDQRTVYETWEFFGGLLAYVISVSRAQSFKSAFDAMARAFKDRAELVD